MDKVMKMSEIKAGMMVKFGGVYRLVLNNCRKENILTIRVRGKAQLIAPAGDVDLEVRIK